MLTLYKDIKNSHFNEKLDFAFLHTVSKVGRAAVFFKFVRWSNKLLGKQQERPIVFYPKKPYPWYDIWNVCQCLNLKMHEDSTGDHMFFFQDKTVVDYVPDALETAAQLRININCTDISKSKVARVFEDVFGYGLAIDPLAYEGQAVEKSEDNGAHDGRVVQCPIKKTKEGYAYQRLINNQLSDNSVEDIRTVVVGNEIPFVYIKHRPVETRFANSNSAVFYKKTEDFLSKEEQAQILEVASKMGLDYGGIDVLRDRGDGRIYIVDVNKTTMGLPIHLPFDDKVESTKKLAEAFDRQFLSR